MSSISTKIEGTDFWTLDSEALERELKPWREKEDCRIKKNGDYHVNTFIILCPYKHCNIFICYFCKKIEGACGPVGCPCDIFPNWHSSYIDGMSKPRAAVLPKGRYRGRIIRSIKRHTYPQSFLNWMNKIPKESEK